MNTSKSQTTSTFASLFVEVSQGKMHYYEAGVGETIVFLHGIPGSSYSWLKVAENLSKEYHVIVPDLMGFNLSSKPVNGYYINAQATCLYELLQKININEVYIAAHDFGGPVAVMFSKLYPAVVIKKMALMATNLFTDTPVPGPMKLARVPLLGQLFFKMMAGSTFGFKQMYKQGTCNKAEFTFAEFKKHITKNNKYYTYKIFLKSLSNLKKHYAIVQEQIETFLIPVLIVWGDKDPFFPVSVGQRSAKAIKNSSLIIYKNTGHFIPEEQPQQLTADLKVFFNSSKQ